MNIVTATKVCKGVYKLRVQTVTGNTHTMKLENLAMYNCNRKEWELSADHLDLCCAGYHGTKKHAIQYLTYSFNEKEFQGA